MYVDIYNSVIPPILWLLYYVISNISNIDIYTKPLKKLKFSSKYNKRIKAGNCIHIIWLYLKESWRNNAKQKHFLGCKNISRTKIICIQCKKSFLLNAKLNHILTQKTTFSEWSTSQKSIAYGGAAFFGGRWFWAHTIRRRGKGKRVLNLLLGGQIFIFFVIFCNVVILLSWLRQGTINQMVHFAN